MLDCLQEKWISEHYEETVALLKELGKIPAPSHHEEQRAEFVKNWFVSRGGADAYIDEAKNVILPIGVSENNSVIVIMAHTDIVFPDTEPLEMREENGRLYAPGIGDDTANLVSLMMAAKYALENRLAPKTGVLIVANACEEGLGNLKGTKQILKDFEGRITEFLSLDGGSGSVVNSAVGSRRVEITVRAQGGHSYSAFGNTNAIVQMSRLIQRLYEKEPPAQAKTTYNAGVIEGGTTVNSIAAECRLMYEYRSESRECLKEMEAFFEKTVDDLKNEGMDISVRELGLRPCKGDVDEEKLTLLTNRIVNIVKTVTEKPVNVGAASTDANAPLSIGIPAVTFGAIEGGGAHTRGEWVRLSSMENAVKCALSALIDYFEVQ